MTAAPKDWASTDEELAAVAAQVEAEADPEEYALWEIAVGDGLEELERKEAATSP